MAPLKRAMLLPAAAAALAGCTPDKPADLAACQKETLRFYSDSTGNEFMIACMEVRGYRFDVLPADCDSRTRMTRQAACYVPNGWMAQFFDWLGRPAAPKPAVQSKARRLGSTTRAGERYPATSRQAFFALGRSEESQQIRAVSAIFRALCHNGNGGSKI